MLSVTGFDLWNFLTLVAVPISSFHRCFLLVMHFYKDRNTNYDVSQPPAVILNYRHGALVFSCFLFFFIFLGGLRGWYYTARLSLGFGSVDLVTWGLGSSVRG
jgi:hypothetical protein